MIKLAGGTPRPMQRVHGNLEARAVVDDCEQGVVCPGHVIHAAGVQEDEVVEAISPRDRCNPRVVLEPLIAFAGVTG